MFDNPGARQSSTQGCQIFLGFNAPKREKIHQIATNYTKYTQNIANGHKIHQISKKCQHLQLQDPPKFTQIRIFGLKICRLATLVSQKAENVGRLHEKNDFEPIGASLFFTYLFFIVITVKIAKCN
jgi:hypothetical protein